MPLTKLGPGPAGILFRQPVGSFEAGDGVPLGGHREILFRAAVVTATLSGRMDPVMAGGGDRTVRKSRGRIFENLLRGGSLVVACRGGHEQ